MITSKSVALHTLGCKLNYSETSTIARLLEKDGFVQKDFDEVADVYIINTCSVTDNADKECRQLVRRIAKKAPDANVVITGCYAQLKPLELSQIQGVDLVLGAAEKFNITAHLKEITKGGKAAVFSCDIDDVKTFHSSFSVNDRTRSFLKVQDGCNYNCSFCTIPLARGASRSDSFQNILESVKALENAGVKEIVLTGINLGDYAYKAGNQNSTLKFIDLVRFLEENTSIERYRISSIEPNLLTDEIIEFVASSKRFMPHFHIPLQSGSDKILGLMQRRYRTALYQQRIDVIKKLMPHCAIGVDVIVGFPAESNVEFNETFKFLENNDISYLHVFTYSERNDTKALTINPVVPLHVRHERNKILRNLSYKKQIEFANKHIGDTRNVLFEKRNKNGTIEGFTDNYITVTAAFDDKLVNTISKWKI
ncbi:MAG: tRNA (N(6)-L-threonylcarbamoyladenosine(37)-C(2))-methylthiotransferase MtaB [Ginsengibacter sp.]